MHILTSFVFGIVLSGLLVTARNVTIDNTSPLVVFSPTPCFQQDTPDCSPEWQLTENTDYFNGSTTTTTGTDPALDFNILPRVSLLFQGSAVIFMPGPNSTAQASVILDNLASILLDTGQDAFSGSGLDPTHNHTITITFVPSNNATILEVDYFLIEQPETNTTSSSTSSLFSITSLPTSLPPSSIPSSSHTSKHSPSEVSTLQQPQSVPAGTIAAVTVSGVLLLSLAALTWFYAARRRRRRAALRREKAILFDLRLPSERSVKDPSVSRVRRWGEEQRERGRDGEMGGEQPWVDTPLREKGKERETDWRTSVLPPVHYTPWR